VSTAGLAVPAVRRNLTSGGGLQRTPPDWSL
jgi:hypothetical protein